MFGLDDHENYKKHSSEECLAFAIAHVTADPSIIRMAVNTTTDAEYALFNNTLLPSVFIPDDWSRTATKRPSRNDERGEDEHEDYDAIYKTIRYYENDVWDENSRDLRFVVTEKFGELDVEVICNW